MRSRSSHSHPTVLGLVLLSACTNGSASTGDPTSGIVGSPAPAAVPATPLAMAPPAPSGAAPTTTAMLAGAASPGASPDPPAEFREFLAADWELAPGTEQYICIRQTFAETRFVSGWRGDAPLGTHHLIVTTSAQPDGEPDGQSECDGLALGTQNVFGAGVGAPDRRLPPGVAVKLAQGAQALLNLHLFNPTDKPLRGRSGVRVQTMEEKDVRELSDFVIASVLQLDVPPGRSTSHARCTFARDATVFGIAPHMHQMGVAMQVVAHTAMHGDIVLFDGPFSFDNQKGYPLDSLQFEAGDIVDVACTFENTSGTTLHWGGSSNDEMCQASLARFPAGGPSVCAK